MTCNNPENKTCLMSGYVITHKIVPGIPTSNYLLHINSVKNMHFPGMFIFSGDVLVSLHSYVTVWQWHRKQIDL